MGQKVNPNGFRLGVNKTWSSRWFSKSNYAKFLHQDLEIKSYVEKKLKNASIAKIEHMAHCLHKENEKVSKAIPYNFLYEF